MTFIILILLHCTLIILYIRWKKRREKERSTTDWYHYPAQWGCPTKN